MTAVLDGQQRLTSLYLALRGTHAAKRPYFRLDAPDAFPVRRLYLNLSRPSADPELTYDFQFRPDTGDLVRDGDGSAWVRAGAVLGFADLGAVISFLRTHGLLADQFPQEALTALFQAVVVRPAVSYYVEASQDLDKVLTIFVRVNSAGTVLSYSDLLLSIATAEWQSLDAREEITRLVDEVNRYGRGFAFTKDFILKTCLAINGGETRFATANFDTATMRAIEAGWPATAAAVRMAVRLLADFGFTAERLPSINAVIPVVYYLHRRGTPTGFADATAYKADRDRIRRWLNVALLKRVFSGQPDSTIHTVREAIRAHGDDGFPADQIAEALRSKPRSMRFEDAELDAILDETYHGGYAFATLALLYPSLDFRNQFHQDHLHPKSIFTRAQLLKRGVPPERSRSTRRASTGCRTSSCSTA